MWADLTALLSSLFGRGENTEELIRYTPPSACVQAVVSVG